MSILTHYDSVRGGHTPACGSTGDPHPRGGTIVTCTNGPGGVTCPECRAILARRSRRPVVRQCDRCDAEVVAPIAIDPLCGDCEQQRIEYGY